MAGTKNGHKKKHDEEDDERHPLTIGINARDDNTRGTRRKHTTAKENTGGKNTKHMKYHRGK